MARKSAAQRPRPRKPRFLIDHDASGTAGAVRDLGWVAYPANPYASDSENVQVAVQRELSILSMDGHFNRFSLQTLPFTLILGGNAQQSLSTASDQLQV